MLERVVDLQVESNYRLRIRFSDGVTGIVDLSRRPKRGVFAPLQDPNFFAQARIDEFGAVCWPNGADLAPVAMHDELVKNDGLWTVGAEFAAS